LSICQIERRHNQIGEFDYYIVYKIIYYYTMYKSRISIYNLNIYYNNDILDRLEVYYMYEMISFGSPTHRPKTKKQEEIDNLSNVFVLEYDDDYHRFSDEPTSEAEREVRKLRNRYKNVPDYVAAKQTYDEYMETLYEYYGGKDMFKKLKKVGMVTHYIPNKPKLRNSKDLKQLFKHCPTIRKMGRNVIDEDNLNSYLKETFPNIKVDDKKSYEYRYWDNEDKQFEETYTIPVQKGDKRAEKIIDKGDNLDYSKNKTGYKKPKGFSYEVDFMQLGFAMKNPKKYKKKKHQIAEDPYKILLSDLMYAKPGDIIFEEEDDDEMSPYKNLIRTSSYKDEMELFTRLSELGWPAYEIMKRSGGYSKRTLQKFNPKKIKKASKRLRRKKRK